MNDTDTSLCRIGCIIFGVIMGAVGWYALSGLVPTIPLIFLFLLITLGAAWLAYQAFCGVSSSTSASSAAPDPKKIGRTDRDFWTSEPAASAAPMASLVATSSTKTKSTKPAKKAAAKPAATKKATSKPAQTKKPAAKKTASKKAPAKSTGPERLKKPRSGKGDDLKLISGVGPKLEKTLNGLGFWHFEQIAKWKKADVAVVDDELKFKGRIERDDWIKQAKALAKGGEAEYIKVFGKKPR